MVESKYYEVSVFDIETELLLPEPKPIVVIPGLSTVSEFTLFAASAVCSALYSLIIPFVSPPHQQQHCQLSLGSDPAFL